MFRKIWNKLCFLLRIKKRFSLRVTGDKFYVDSEIGKNYPSSGRGLSPGKPFKTIGYAWRQVVKDNSVIYVMPKRQMVTPFSDYDD